MNDTGSIDTFNSLLLKDFSSELEIIAESNLLDNIDWDTLLNEVEGLKALWKFGKGIEQRIYIRNLAILLTKQKGINDKQKKIWQKRLESDKKCKRLVENLLILMYRLHDPYKTKIISNLFRAFLKEDLELSNLLRLMSVVENCYHDDLVYFEVIHVNFDNNKYSNDEILKLRLEEDFHIQNLFVHGIFEENKFFSNQSYVGDTGGNATKLDVANMLDRANRQRRKDISVLGRLLMEHGFD